MPKKSRRKQDSTHGSWSTDNLNKAIKAIHDGLSIRKASIDYHIPRKTLERRFKTGNLEKSSMGRRCALGIENEIKLVEHIKKSQKHGFSITRDDLRTFAYKFAKQLGVKNNFNDDLQKAGYDWLQLFLSRHPDLSIHKAEDLLMSRSDDLNKVEVSSYFNILEQMLSKYDLFDKPGSIFNIDKLCFQLNNPQLIAERGDKSFSSIKLAKKSEKITVVACCNSKGMFIPPVYIMKDKNKKKEFEHNMPPGSIVYMSEKYASMNTDILFVWLQEQFLPRKPAGTVLLILDAHVFHCNSLQLLEFAESNAIILICLPRHTTHYLQPLDQVVFKSIEQTFSNAAKKWINPGCKLTRLQFGVLFSECWEQSATSENAIAGFRATGIYPFNPDAVTTSLNKPMNEHLVTSSEDRQEPEENVLIGSTCV